MKAHLEEQARKMRIRNARERLARSTETAEAIDRATYPNLKLKRRAMRNFWDQIEKDQRTVLSKGALEL